MAEFKNPFRPGAGHSPPYLAGRSDEKQEFLLLLDQQIILENMVLTGLRGVGKTVLLDSFKPIAINKGWLWIGTDLSESTSVSEENIAVRVCADLSIVTSSITLQTKEWIEFGFTGKKNPIEIKLDYHTLMDIYNNTPGLSLDKLKAVLEITWKAVSNHNPQVKGIVFAYDEAQNLSDQAAKEQFPLSLLLDTFQSIQKKEFPLMLALTGLPTLFPKLVEARTFSERMFRVIFLKSLAPEESRDAIEKPIQDTQCPIILSKDSVQTAIEMSGGYPYFLQFICKEVYDSFIQRIDKGKNASVPATEIERKLDTDFFAGRWNRATDRQRELMYVIAELDQCDEEFTVQDIVLSSKLHLEKPFSSSHVGQILSALTIQGLVFKNRYGKYSFAVPLLGKFINREIPPQIQ